MVCKNKLGYLIQDSKTRDFQIQIQLAPDHGPSASGPNSPALEKPLMFPCELSCDQICLCFVCRVNQQWQYRIACRKLKSAEVTALQCYLERSALLLHADNPGISAKQFSEAQTQTLTYRPSLYHLKKRIFRITLSSQTQTGNVFVAKPLWSKILTHFWNQYIIISIIQLQICMSDIV